MTQYLTVPPGAASQRLDVFLADTTGHTRSQAAKLIRAGGVRINGQAERPSYVVVDGDAIEVDEIEPVSDHRPAPELPIVYEDEAVLVIDKPAGMVVHSGAGVNLTATVSDFARGRTHDPDPDRPGIVHRLDRDTSGLLIIAKTVAAKAELQAAFKTHQVHKTYHLLVIGHPEPDAAVIRLPVGRNPKKPLEQAVVAGGREASTAYRTLEPFVGYSLIEAKPETGRTHQLRVHFAALGHAIAGDITYGSPKRVLDLKRQFLHASAIEFMSPTGTLVSLVSPLPPELTSVLERLRSEAAS